MQRHYRLQLLSFLLVPGFIFTFVCPVLATYTALTISEISPIPFSCPRSYPYTSPKIKEACEIRAANLIFMWLNIICLIILITLICYLQIDKPKKYKSIRGNGNGGSKRRRSHQKSSSKQAESNAAALFVARLFGDQVSNQKSEAKKQRQDDSRKIVDTQLQIA
ncbi:7264_t:CDS:2 [Dentiscutata heterogama]|uniref:7264_t:CDS:1 n=1 Tax=Dentiscutata heterogama TaxID=1316150 RepID=A0ACA9K6W2_9GLOM|nr:7264_t:CDS:2 [Dentiscutata heterogama]